MTRVHEKKQILGSEMQHNCTKNLKTEDGMGFESGNSVVSLLIVLLANEVTLMFSNKFLLWFTKLPFIGFCGFSMSNKSALDFSCGSIFTQKSESE